MAEGERPRDRFGRFLPGRSSSEESAAQGGGGAPETVETRSGERSEPPPASREMDISDTPAPSVGPHTTFERQSPEERLAGHEQSSVDAMGLDKRRPVVGGRYSPSFARQATIYGVFLAVVAALAIGFIVLAGKLDEPPDTNPDVAPWSREDAAQVPPAPLDFPRYGQSGGAAAPGPEL
ncbi:MAG: hypothetical protein ACRDKX_05225 [Solirubrobacterales bacterium]